MEKKNMVLLTVIAVATLLVAVVGATFAYFTATVETTNPDQKTDTVKTKTLASAKMTYGDKFEITDALPGWKGIKELHVEGDGEAGADPITATIKIALDATEFDGHVKYTLYKATNQIEELESKCQASAHNAATDGQYYDEMSECEPATLGLTSVVNSISGSTATNSSADITVTYNTNDYYYLFVEYENVSGEQNDEQGKTFTATVDFVAKDQAN